MTTILIHFIVAKALALILTWGLGVGLLVAAALLFAGPLKRLAIALAIAGGLWLAGTALVAWHVHAVDAARAAGDAAGAARVDAAWKAASRMAEERAARANAAAEALQTDTIAALTAQISDLEAQKKEDDDAAARDPHAGDTGLGVDGVRRLNAIGHASQAH